MNPFVLLEGGTWKDMGYRACSKIRLSFRDYQDRKRFKRLMEDGTCGIPRKMAKERLEFFENRLKGDSYDSLGFCYFNMVQQSLELSNFTDARDYYAKAGSCYNKASKEVNCSNNYGEMAKDCRANARAIRRSLN